MFVSEIVVNDTLSIPFIILYIALPFFLVQRFLWTASNFLHGTTCLFSSPISFFLLLILNFGIQRAGMCVFYAERRLWF